jgi:hypothetical protein
MRQNTARLQVSRDGRATEDNSYRPSPQLLHGVPEGVQGPMIQTCENDGPVPDSELRMQRLGWELGAHLASVLIELECCEARGLLHSIGKDLLFFRLGEGLRSNDHFPLLWACLRQHGRCAQ